MNNLKLFFLLGLLSFYTACDKENDTVTPTSNNIVELQVNGSALSVINLMKPDSVDKEQALTLLQDGLEQTMRSQPGFISSSLHASLDNNYIINYAQWESGDDLQAAATLVGNGGAPNMAQAFNISNPDYHPFSLTAQYKPTEALPQIDQAGELLTIINVLVPADGVTQQELATMLKVAMEEEVLPQDGFVSATIHESMDNDFIINYAQWRDGDALNGMIEKLQSGNAPKLGTAFSKATADFHPFTVVKTYFPE